MRICVILEGCYPYVTGGVSTWIHQYMKAMPQHEFIIWAIGADAKQQGNYKYEFPPNVVEIHEIFLDEALRMPFLKGTYKFNKEELKALRECVNCGRPDWELLFRMYHDKKISPIAFLMSQDFLEILTMICREEYPYTSFSDLFHTIRSMLLPLLYVIQSDVPKADLYHSIATGYAGVLARLGSYVCKVPYIITEHGIYTREREEEIIRAKWVVPAFKRFWVRFFYMLSNAAYEKATAITSLFDKAMEMQIEMGCEPAKCRYITNGIHFDRFCNIPMKKENGHVDIGAVLRIAPIKDIKTMLYAFAELKSRISNVRLHICGPEDDEEYAQECYALKDQLALSDDEVIFTGPVNVLEYMENFDFTLLTSISEGQPLAVLESFAAGRPCVVTDVGCCKQLIGGMTGDTLGQAGYCVPPMYKEAMADAMEFLCTHQETCFQMGKIGKERVEKFFRHEDMISNYQQLYDEVMKEWQELDSV